MKIQIIGRAARAARAGEPVLVRISGPPAGAERVEILLVAEEALEPEDLVGLVENGKTGPDGARGVVRVQDLREAGP